MRPYTFLSLILALFMGIVGTISCEGDTTNVIGDPAVTDAFIESQDCYLNAVTSSGNASGDIAIDIPGLVACLAGVASRLGLSAEEVVELGVSGDLDPLLTDTVVRDVGYLIHADTPPTV